MRASAAEVQIEAVEKGDPAPFSGDLFPHGTSVRWALELAYCEQRGKLERDLVQKTSANDRDTYVRIAEAEALADKERIKILTGELEAARAWHKSPGFVASVAALISVGVLVTAAVIVSAIPEAVP